MKLLPQNSHYRAFLWASVVFFFDYTESANNCTCFHLMKIFLIMPDYDPHCCRSRDSTVSFDRKYLERREIQTEVNQCSFLAASFVLYRCLNPVLRGKRDMIHRWSAELDCMEVNKALHLWFPVFSLLRLPLRRFLYCSLYLQSCLHNLIAYKICNYKISFIVYAFLILMLCLYCVR